MAAAPLGFLARSQVLERTKLGVGGAWQLGPSLPPFVYLFIMIF